MSDDESWRRIQDDAKAQVRAELVGGESSPLSLGAFVAWAIQRVNRTKGLSRAHRVGEPMPHTGAEMTLCGEIIPLVNRRVPLLTQRLARTLGLCPWCEQLHAEMERAKENSRPGVERRSVTSTGSP